MKPLNYIIAIVMTMAILTSCSDDNDFINDLGIFGTRYTETDYKGTPPAPIKVFIAENYPGYVINDIDIIKTLTEEYLEVELDHATQEDLTVFFKTDGTWFATERDYHGTLPQAVTDYIAVNMPEYRIDDVDFVETPTGNYYLVELEAHKMPDVHLKITADGTIVN